MAIYPSHSNNRTAKSPKKALQKSSGDVYLPDSRDTDIVIPVLGQTGAGKSTFINNLLGRGVAKVGQGIDPETTQVRAYTLPHPDHRDRRLVILDAPGFNSTPDDETSIFARVAEWLAHSYHGMSKTFAGVIYLHEITQTRLQAKPLRLLKQQCNGWGITNVVLATTKWDEIPQEIGDHREQLLVGEWRNEMQGGQMCRLFNASQSAHDVRRLVLERATGLSGGPLSNSDRMNSERPRGVRENQEGSVHADLHPPERARDRRLEDENRDAGSFYGSTQYPPNTTLNAGSQQVGTGGTIRASSPGGSVQPQAKYHTPHRRPTGNSSNTNLPSSSKGAGRQQKKKMNGSGGPMSHPSITDSPRPSLLCCC